MVVRRVFSYIGMILLTLSFALSITILVDYVNWQMTNSNLNSDTWVSDNATIIANEETKRDDAVDMMLAKVPALSIITLCGVLILSTTGHTAKYIRYKKLKK